MKSPFTLMTEATLEGRYEVQQVIGQGPFCTVFEAFDTEKQREVALQVLRLDPSIDLRTFVPRYFAEGARRVRLVHPHTVRVHDHGRTNDDTFFVAMERLHGRRLGYALSDRGPFTPTAAATVCERVCASLEEAHALDILHGWLTPDSIWLTGRGIEGLKVSGHCALALHGDDPSKWPTHTLRYAAPEVLATATPLPQTDVYGVGLLLFELLTGRPAFSEESSVRLAMRQRDGGPCRGLWYERLCHTCPTLAGILERCLAPHPMARYESMTRVRAALSQHLEVRAA